MDGKQGFDELETQNSKKRRVLEEKNVEGIDNDIVMKFSEKKDEVEIVLPSLHKDVLKSVGVDDPAVFLMYDPDNLSNIAAAVNARQPPSNNWLGITQFPISARDLQEAIANQIGNVAGGVVCRTLFAPCTFQQYRNVGVALGYLGLDPVFNSIGIAPLAQVYCIADGRRNTTGVRDPIAAPPGGIHLFQ